MTGTRNAILAALFLIGAAAPASAYTAYIKPADFSPETDLVNIELAFATEFFTPAVAMSSPNLHALRPDGQRIGFDGLAVSAQSTRLELNMWRPGTYRFSTGERLGDVVQMIGVDGGWRPLTTSDVVTIETPLSTLQTVTVAEAYASRGYPSNEVLAAQPAGRLAIRPITHPNLVTPETGLVLELLFDGAPFPNMPFVLNTAGDQEANLDTNFVTDAAGRAHIVVPAPGLYVATIRYRANAPEGSAAQVQSYTTSLTFEVLAQLPPPPPPPEPERRGRRNRNRD